MTKSLTNPEKSNSRLSTIETFISDAKKELERIKRYGHRATFMIIKPDIPDSIENIVDYTEFLYNCIKKELRGCDSVYFFNDLSFTAILPDTHEGGGESAALRLKRKISHASDKFGQKISSSIGLVSVGQDNISDIKSVIEALKRDLERDKKCQSYLNNVETVHKKQLGAIIWCKRWFEAEKIKKSLKPYADVLITDDLEEVNGFLIGKTYCVAFCLPGIEYDGFMETLKKYLYNRRLKNIFNIMVGDIKDFKSEFDLCLPENSSSQVFAYSILSAFTILNKHRNRNEIQKYLDTFSAISSATHQLNQPLQIIIGKIELLLLDIEENSHIAKEAIQKTLAEIRKQVLYSADINQKINRLTKF